MIIYYERYVVIQAGDAENEEGESLEKMDFLSEEEYLKCTRKTYRLKTNILMILTLPNSLRKWELSV